MQTYITKPFYANDIIFKEGSTGQTAYVLKIGSVEISIKEGDQKTVWATLGPGSVFGEMVLLLKDQKRTATATALEYTELVEISRDSFEKFLESSPVIIKKILSALANRLQSADTKMVHVPDIYTAICRVFHLLFAHGIADIRYDLALAEIATALSLDTKIIHEQISQLEQLHLIMIKTDAQGHKMISSSEGDFLPRAIKLHEVLINFGNKNK